MKKMLLLLLALTAAPAWAEQAAAPAPAAQTAVAIELSGSAKDVRALLSGLEKDAVYKDAGCSSKPMKKTAKTAKISCTNAGGALLDYLGKNTPDKVRWSISGAAKSATAAAACLRIQCGGVTACFYKGCTGSCSPC